MKHSCGGCPAKWTGLRMAHCAAEGCHRTFSTPANFDAHRVKGKCVDPGSIILPENHAFAGRPKFRVVDGMWVQANYYDEGTWKDSDSGEVVS